MALCKVVLTICLMPFMPIVAILILLGAFVFAILCALYDGAKQVVDGLEDSHES